jgi:hypothetical protein
VKHHLETAWNKDDLLATAAAHGLNVTGTGKDGRVLKADVAHALDAAGLLHVPAPATAPEPPLKPNKGETEMATSYEVRHAFAVQVTTDGKPASAWVTPDQNAEHVESLSREQKDALIEAGHIIEHDDRKGSASAEPPAKGGN